MKRPSRGAAHVGNDNVVVRTLLGAAAGQTNFQCHFLFLDSNLVVGLKFLTPVQRQMGQSSRPPACGADHFANDEGEKFLGEIRIEIGGFGQIAQPLICCISRFGSDGGRSAEAFSSPTAFVHPEPLGQRMDQRSRRNCRSSGAIP
jgi:hypothetical protein